MNRKRWIIIGSVIIIIALITVPFIISQQEQAKNNEQFDSAFSNVIGISLLTERSANDIAQKYENVISNSGLSYGVITEKIDTLSDDLISQGKTDKMSNYSKKLDDSYNKLTKLSTSGIKSGDKKKKEAKKLYGLTAKYLTLINNPRSDSYYVSQLDSRFNQILSQVKVCDRLLN